MDKLNQQPIIITITARHCGKLQPKVRVGKSYPLLRKEQTATGTTVYVCADGNKEIRINEHRFSVKLKQMPTPETRPQVAPRKTFTEKLEQETKDIATHFSEEEYANLSCFPFIYYFLAINYADQCLNYTITHRVEFTKKVGREYKQWRESWYNRLGGALGPFAQFLEQKTTQFWSDNNSDFSKLYFCVNTHIKKHIEVEHEQLATLAGMAILLACEVKREIEFGDNLVKQRIGHALPSYGVQYMTNLLRILKGYSRKGCDYNASATRRCRA